MKNKKIKCDIYTRESTTMQVDGYSLDAQKEKLKRYAEFQNMEIVNEYSDEGKLSLIHILCKEFEMMRSDLADNNRKMWRMIDDERALRNAIAHDIRCLLYTSWINWCLHILWMWQHKCLTALVKNMICLKKKSPIDVYKRQGYCHRHYQSDGLF